MDLLDQGFAILADVAWKMGHGQGFWITFGTYMTMLAIERIAYLFEGAPRWDERDAWANVGNALLTLAFDALVFGAIVVGVYLWVYDHRIAMVPFVWWGWLLAFVLNDLAYYVDHRIAHRTGFLWAIHTSHHSSREMNLLVANRGTVLGGGGLLSPAYFVLALVGVHPAMWLAVKFFGNLWGIFNHTRLVGRMGVLEDWLCTPANHRVHHGVDTPYLDRNYGQTLLIWDRLFGTWQRETVAPTFGLVEQMDSRRIWDIQTWGVRRLVARMRAAPTWGDRLRYLWKPPGWSHDGRHSTTEAIRTAPIRESISA